MVLPWLVYHAAPQIKCRKGSPAQPLKHIDKNTIACPHPGSSIQTSTQLAFHKFLPGRKYYIISLQRKKKEKAEKQSPMTHLRESDKATGEKGKIQKIVGAQPAMRDAPRPD